MKLHRPERDVLASVLSLLKARGIFALRMNVGGVRASYRGKERYVRFGVPGMADVLALPRIGAQYRVEEVSSFTWRIDSRPSAVWIECKSSTGKQSQAQREFQATVEAEGHQYIVVHSASELNDWLQARGI